MTCGRRAAPGIGEAHHVVCDLGRPGEPERVVAEAQRELGRIDVPRQQRRAIADQRRFEDVTDEQWEACWQLNVMSYVRTIRAALPYMRASGGRAARS